MDQFALLGPLALKLHGEFRVLYYTLLPIFFALSLVFAWFRHPQGGPDFLETIKRAFVATLLMVGFAEITDAILFVTNGIATKIDDMAGFDALLNMAGEKAKSYTLSPTSVILAFNDLLVSSIAFLSYIILYIARYIMVALFHFSWIFLSIIAPLMLLFHLFSPKITLSLFRSMAEVASWKIVWSVLSAMLAALPFGNAYMADGNYLTVIVLNFVIALCMLGTPLVVHSLIGGGLSSMTGALGTAVAATMVAGPTKVASVMKFGREMLTDTHGFTKHLAGQIAGGGSTTPRTPSSPAQSGSSDALPKNTPPPQSSGRSSPPPQNRS